MENPEMIECACGCGQRRVRFDSKGNERLYLPGHNDHWSKSRRPPIVCPTCQKEFRPRGGVVKDVASYRQQYCSATCWYASNAGKNHAKYSLVDVECSHCGKTFSRKPSHLGTSSGRRFCSRICYSRYAVAHKSPVAPKSVVALVLERDAGKCKICGFGEIVQVHHIVPRREHGQNVTSNLITLCPNHHKLADLDKISREALVMLVTA